MKTAVELAILLAVGVAGWMAWRLHNGELMAAAASLPAPGTPPDGASVARLGQFRVPASRRWMLIDSERDD